jgi:hypothetical protein
MDRPDLPPNKRRRPQELQGSLDRIRQADANYFRRFPGRQHRIRVAASVEIEEAKLLGTEQHYIAVWKLTPDGDCWRLLMTGPPDADVESYAEWRAKLVFFHNAGGHGLLVLSHVEEKSE